MSNIQPVKFRFRQYELWRGELPPRSDFEPVQLLVEEFDGFELNQHTDNTDTKYAAVKTKTNGMYGLLGASFTPSVEDNILRVEVASTGSNPSIPRQGLNERFALSVMDSMIRMITIDAEDVYLLGAGLLRFDHANQHPVESSRRGFQRLVVIILWLLQAENALLTEEELIQAFARLRLP